MSDNRNPVPDNFTGITAAIGGYNSWSPYGGSRLILTKGNNYKLFDLTSDTPIELKYTLNVSQLQCGINNAVYMVPMIDADNDPKLNNLAGTLYNDAQNIGFVQQEGTGMNSRLGRTEIDITECSPRGIQTTLHGYGDKKQAKDVDRWQNDLDMSGIWRNANVDKDGNFLGNGNLVYGNSKQKDTLPSDAIDTVNPVDVYCKITSTKVSLNPKQTYQDGKVTGPFYTLKMETVISQKGKNDIYMMVDSANPKGEHDITTYFPESELKNMVLLWSLWADTKEHDYLNWLDGTVDGASFGKHRGNCTEAEYSPIGLFQEAVNNFSNPDGSNNDVQTFIQKLNDTNASKNTFITNLYDLSIKEETDLTSYGWVMDYGYRGINEHQFKQEEEGGDCGAGKQCTYFKPDSNQLTNWRGRYNFSYLNCNITADYNIPTPNTDISTKSYPWGNPGGEFENVSKACTMLINDKDNIKNQRKDDSQAKGNPPPCSWNSKDKDCQKIDMPLVDFGSSPSPLGPCPKPPCPPGTGPHGSSLSIVGIISLSLSALIIIIILLMIFHVKFTF